MPILIKSGRVIDPDRFNAIADILIEKGKITAVMPQTPAEAATVQDGAGHHDLPESLETIDAAGKIVTPGLIDMHVHFREPGDEHKETVQTGCAAAAHGGFAAICPMPNTRPAHDSPQVIEFVLDQARKAGTIRIYPVAAISQALKGEVLCDFRALKTAGAIAVSDDGMPVVDSRLMRRAMEAARELGLLVIAHSEDLDLARGGVMNEGPTARRLGVQGIPNAAESITVMRDIALCELTGAPLHIAHVSTAESVRVVRAAKKRDLPVTAETGPHYFTLTDAAVAEYGAYAKMNPPLRSEKDRQAVRQGLADGTLDVIATDHAPHSDREKKGALEKAANGIIGLETSLALGLKLVADNVLSLSELIKKMATNPARILGLETGVTVGSRADITIIDPDKVYTVAADTFQSKSRNTPFDGWTLKGRAVMTMVDGRIVFRDSDL